jgi:hypothetical protein
MMLTAGEGSVFWMDKSKLQGAAPPTADGLGAGHDREPGYPARAPAAARTIAHAEVAGARSDWRAFQELPRVKVFSDFHCVTRWSRRAIFGASLPLEDFLAEDALVALTHDGEPIRPGHRGPARLIVPRLYAWKSANLQRRPLPQRLVPGVIAKWVSGVELLERDRAGVWERNGYHMRGDPWKEERHSY